MAPQAIEWSCSEKTCPKRCVTRAWTGTGTFYYDDIKGKGCYVGGKGIDGGNDDIKDKGNDRGNDDIKGKGNDDGNVAVVAVAIKGNDDDSERVSYQHPLGGQWAS